MAPAQNDRLQETPVFFDDELPIDPDLALGDPGESRPRRARPDVLVAIALGGAIGTTLRAGLGQAFPTPIGQFPATTLTVNLFGSFVLGVIVVVLVERFGPSSRLGPFLTTGILGGFTTFSTFTVESAQLARHGHLSVAIAYVAVSIFGGIIAAFGGIMVGRAVAKHGVADPGQDNGGIP